MKGFEFDPLGLYGLKPKDDQPVAMVQQTYNRNLFYTKREVDALLSTAGSGSDDWNQNTYGSINYLQPSTTSNGLVIGSDLHSTITSAYNGISAVFNGDVAGSNTGINYFGNFGYGSSFLPLGGVFLSGIAGGTPSAPTAKTVSEFLGGWSASAYDGSAWLINGASHIVAGLWANISAITAGVAVEKNIWIGGVTSPMISFNTDNHAIKFNESLFASDITFYYDVGTALSIAGATGVVSLPQGARITPRITTITSSATPTINTDNCDAVTITALAAAITSMTSGLSGTPNNFDKLIIRIKDNGTARAITWGASFEAKGVALPTTTVISKVLTVGFLYDTVTAKWGCVASAQEA